MDHPRSPSLDDEQVAVRAVEAGANVVRSRYGSVLTRIPKEANDFATDADVDAERAMIETLRAMRPGDGISGEELGAIRADPERTWLIDPLCGTRNFAAQTPMVAVNAALRAHDRVIAAAVAAPMSGEVYSTDGQVARRRIGPQTVMITPSPRTMLVDVDMDTDPRRTAAIAADLASRGYGIRVSSTSLALAWVADGRRAAYVTAVDVRDSVHERDLMARPATPMARQGSSVPSFVPSIRSESTGAGRSPP
jgi:myo-inositol-1(or 4)-monophosphatase